MFEFLDKNMDGKIPIYDFILIVAKKMDENRTGVVDRLFKRIQPDGNISRPRLESLLDLSQHPELMTKKKSLVQVRQRILGGLATFCNFH